MAKKVEVRLPAGGVVELSEDEVRIVGFAFQGLKAATDRQLARAPTGSPMEKALREYAAAVTAVEAKLFAKA